MSTPAFSNRPSETATLDALTELALDLRWSFNHSADKLWERLDPDLWDLTHNPCIVLQTVSEEKLQSVTTDPDFQLLVAGIQSEKQAVEQSQESRRHAFRPAPRMPRRRREGKSPWDRDRRWRL
jgi:starch phosphorylase